MAGGRGPMNAVETSERPTTSQGNSCCYHCGEPCESGAFTRGDLEFCCNGCLVVHELLSENGLGRFYELGRTPGVRSRTPSSADQWACLDDPSVRDKLLDYTDGRTSRITLKLPSIHCIACVWLLENSFRLHSGINWARVNFPEREAAFGFNPDKIKLSELAALLASIGYAPALTLDALGGSTTGRDEARAPQRRQWLQIGVAGFAFGNVMLFSLPSYLDLDSYSGPAFKVLFGYLSLILAVPVVVFSAADYWQTAWVSVRRRILTLDVPIALGLAALYAWSAFEIIFGVGDGYLDSMCGLVFFLLCGRAFQRKTHERISFDRDYKAFFPLSVRRCSRVDPDAEECVALSQLEVGDRIIVRNGELIPADSRLERGEGLIDYSFVTGESDPVNRSEGDHVYAGGRQAGAAVELTVVKPVSQSYLSALWNHEAFGKRDDENLNTLTNRYSRRFTRVVIAVALLALAGWAGSGDPGRGVKAFTSVLIVACPCALALAAPFALGTAQRWLGRGRVFLKNAHVLEHLARVDTIVFDKTGTLTSAGATVTAFDGAPLAENERRWIHALTRQSSHPFSASISEYLAVPGRIESVEQFREIPGRGISGRIDGHWLHIGSADWLRENGVVVESFLSQISAVLVAIDGSERGRFGLRTGLRAETERVIKALDGRCELALLSGDNERDRERFVQLLGQRAVLRFNQSPVDKLNYILELQQRGRTVMMVGDGLNDAGALRQSDVGVAVVEKIGVFSPGSDVILQADDLSRLPAVLNAGRTATRIVRAGFVISAAYNVVGVSIAAWGILSPLICAVLMPVSSFSVVFFASGAATWSLRRLSARLDRAQDAGSNSLKTLRLAEVRS